MKLRQDMQQATTMGPQDADDRTKRCSSNNRGEVIRCRQLQCN